MDTITIEHNVTPVKLDTMAVDSWPIWSKEASTFDWHYDQTEVCYILEGEVVVTPKGGNPVTIVAGDLVSFPAGMKCNWNIKSEIRKHYMFK
ncbi:MAG: cupin domain-containing protein [Gammaproteobacteria bacterium]|nr:cupin domain-containing protein [Gammaproteobacteria bacterium]